MIEQRVKDKAQIAVEAFWESMSEEDRKKFIEKMKKIEHNLIEKIKKRKENQNEKMGNIICDDICSGLRNR